MPPDPSPLEAKVPKGRGLKKDIRRLLGEDNFPLALDRIVQLPPRRVVNPLFSFLYHGDPPLLRWRAVTAMGRVVSRQAESDMASAQVVIRRLMWNLNDESGGIGWGSPEAMGDILACSPPLARNYHRILISYIDPAGNFLEHEVLQQGALWALGRLFHTRPETGADSAGLLLPFLNAPDAARRGLAAWAAAPLATKILRDPLEALTGDNAVLQIYMNMTLVEKRVNELARMGGKR
jgi:hypothetical protein